MGEPNEPEDSPPYKNVVKFYSDNGALIYTVPIPYTQALVTALTWGHAARRLFVGLGGAVCTARVWRVVAPLQLLARVRAAAALRHPRLAAKLPLPPRLQPALASLFAHTIRVCIPLVASEDKSAKTGTTYLLYGFAVPSDTFYVGVHRHSWGLHCTFQNGVATLAPWDPNLYRFSKCNVPEAIELRRFVSRPPSAGGRLHCTMLRHDDEEAGAYTLYLEHLGGLVPLLKGRRTSKIRPEFVIFDPQGEEGLTNTVRESSSSSSGANSASSSGSGGSIGGGISSPRPPRTPRAPRRAPRQPPHDDSCSSDTEREDGCSGSPRLQRRRRARERRKTRNAKEEKDETPDELAYIDSLPEDVRLVEVTSNIWGTKFKMHGLAKNVPANLGQVTYKTSLLHLQPRQMTLMITELRDDYPVDPDPTFNPNIFSEDEEEVFPNSEANSPSHINNNIRKKFNPLIMSDRMTNTNNIINQSEIFSPNNNSNPSLARAESYDEFPFIDTNDTMNNENVYNSNTVRHATQTAERRVNNSAAVSNRHAISPLRCESSVPTLQSPKNAVAPTDIIFERPSPQTVTCGGRGDFCGGRTDYSVRDNNSLKGNLSNIEQQSFSLNLSLEPSRQVTIKKCDNHVTDNCLSKLRKNICSRGESSFEMNTRILKSLCNKNYEHEVHPDAMIKRTETLKNAQKSEDLKFIDEETPVDTNINNVTDKVRESRVQRTTTVVPISPVCANIPVYDTMTRSCSVGYLDMVDPQVLHAQVSLTALRGEPPRRLILVNNKRQRRPRRYLKSNDIKQIESFKTPTLKKCGKSKSLDSGELSIAADKGKRQSKAESSVKNDNASANSSSRCNSTGEDNSGTSTEEGRVRRSRRDLVTCTACRLVTPRERRDSDTPYVCTVCCATTLAAPRPVAPPAPLTDSDSDYSKYYSSLEQLALRLLASRSKRSGASEGAGAISRESSSAPASPRLARSSASPAPASPAPRASRRQRYSSASPIRQLLNSPLLNRRRNKKLSESSDDEYSNGYNEVNSKNYRDLESFQKAQLRNKLKRAGGNITTATASNAPDSHNNARRQLVMHNKAPMWNENSQVYQLDFGGRVTQESAKNFQIEYHGKQVMQFGRIDGNAYTLDFQYPFSALQAFAVALANVTQRLK
ncbi:jg22452 [Pararge aegeria aegeria]|uniref:Jg22452 protein n=1 Tax=Pararge aegeria aegeria TaxID=348720 RepID=A0A8S4RU90_9NEOP|nr:jg22452 [Pararge aegeria aegeria]